MRGWDLHLREVVAVRLLAPPDGSDQVVERASVLADLTHPGLVRVLDVGNADGEPFVVFEFIAGTPLGTRLANGPLPAGTVSQIGVMLAKALAYAHSHAVAHRDVRPGNILLGPADEPYLTDLGITEATTPSYMAPEQVNGTPPGPATDVYALGLVLLESLTGRTEYPGNDAASIRARLTHPPRISPELPFAAALQAMTATEPADRPAAAACVELLRGPAAKSRVQTTRTVLIAAVAAAVVATGAALVFSAPRRTTEPQQAIGVEQTRPQPTTPYQGTPPQTGTTTTAEPTTTRIPTETATSVTTPSTTTATTTPPPEEIQAELPSVLLPSREPAMTSEPASPTTATSTAWYEVLELSIYVKKSKKASPAKPSGGENRGKNGKEGN
jgi:serine/threonine protein kinase